MAEEEDRCDGHGVMTEGGGEDEKRGERRLSIGSKKGRVGYR